MSLRLGLRLGTEAGSEEPLGARKLSGMRLPRNGLAGRMGQTCEAQSKAPRPLLAPTHSRQKRRIACAAVGRLGGRTRAMTS
jgi:hypothetical protein